MNLPKSRPWHYLTVTVLAGALAALGQAPWGLWYVALPAFALGFHLILTAPRAGRAGWFFGFGHFAVALHWIVEPFFVQIDQTGWMAPFALVFLAGGLALFWAVAAWGAGYLGPRNPLALAVSLAGMEYIRGHIFTGFPWAEPGHILIMTPVLPLASIVGPFGFTVLILCLAAGLAYQKFWSQITSAAAIGALFFLGAVGFPDPPQADVQNPVVRLVQPNAPQHLKWRPDKMPMFFSRALRASAAPSAEGVDLILWPETSLPAYLEDSERVRARVAEAAGGVPVLVGALGYDTAPRNTVLHLDASGEIVDIYYKHHLVPFGEYLPFSTFFQTLGIRALAASVVGDFKPGPGPALMDVPGIGAVFPMICYEAIFPRYFRQVERPRVLVHLTNDAWFGTFAGPQQHLALAQLRAAESGIPVIRAANTGISAVIDARGAIIDQLPLNTAGPLDVRLPDVLPETFYVRFGDWPALVFVIGLGLGLILHRRHIFN